MYESNHVMLRILSDDAGLGAPVNARYEAAQGKTLRRGKNRNWMYGLGGDTVAAAVSIVAMISLAFLG